MKIKLTTGFEYDLSDNDAVRKLEGNIRNFRTRKRTEEIKHVYEQVKPYQDYKGTNPSHKNARRICQLLQPDIQKLTTATSAVRPTEKKKLVSKKTELVIQDTADDETGQDSFLQLSRYFIFDLENFQSENEYVIWYLAIALNFNMHCSSHAPLPGYGKVQKLEQQHPLYYARSQINHPSRMHYDRLIKEEDDTRKTSVFPFNKEQRKILKDTIIPEDEAIDNESAKDKRIKAQRQEIIRTLKAIDPVRGFPKKGKKIPNYFTSFLAHAGLRKNTLKVFTDALDEAVKKEDQDEDFLLDKFKEQLPKRIPKAIKKLDEATIGRYIVEIKKRFKTLQQQADKFAVQVNLQQQMHNQRQKLINKTITEAKKIDKKLDEVITLEAHGSNCILLRIDPTAFKFPEKLHKDYNKHLTKALVGFFQGLVNYHAKQMGLVFHLTRRQSFGFLRATISDCEEFCLRLSLGLEPELFHEVIVASIKDLQGALKAELTLPTQISKIKSVHAQAQAGHEAMQYCETHTDNPAGALAEYLNVFVSEDKKKNENPEVTPIKKANLEKTNGTDNALFALLQNVLNYALTFVSQFEADIEQSELKHFKHSYWHALLKLYQHCHDALDFLNAIQTKEVSVAYKEANCLVENILEYLIALDSLQQIHLKMMNKELTREKVLETTEVEHAAQVFGLKESQVNVYFSDSGQQAIVTSLLALDFHFFLAKAHERRGEANIYNFNKSYFELDSFLQDVGDLKNENKKTATIAFIDMTQLDELKFKQFPQLQALVIDTTREQTLSNEKLKSIIAEAHKKNIWVVLANSCLKHDELGLDKYLAGKITILAPNTEAKLKKDAVAIFDSVCAYTSHPAIASFLQMVNEICQDKPLPKTALPVKAQTNAEKQLNPAASQGMKNFGFHAPQKQVGENAVNEKMQKSIAIKKLNMRQTAC